MQTSDILQTAKRQRGHISATQARASKISGMALQRLVQSGKLHHPARGIYTLPDSWEDDFFILQNQCTRGIFSGMTALYLWRMTDRTPSQIEMIFPQGYNLGNVKARGIIARQAVPAIYADGIAETKTETGLAVKLYSRERTLCELLRFASRYDRDLIVRAFRDYATDAVHGNTLELMRFAKLFKVEAKVRSYMEVLL